MRILLLTAGERVSASGLYNSQVAELAISYAKLGHVVKIVSFLPYFNTDLLDKQFNYEAYLMQLRSKLKTQKINLSIIRLPLSSHFQFIGFKLVYLFWRNPIINLLLYLQIKNFSPDILHCRSIIAATLATNLSPKIRQTLLINFDLRGNAVTESTLIYQGQSRIIRNLNRIQRNAIDKSDSITCVSGLLAKQCKIPSCKNLYITKIASSLKNQGLSSFSSDNQSIRKMQKFVYIGSIGKTWYPFDEFIMVALKIQEHMPGASFTILCPTNTHTIVNKTCSKNHVNVNMIAHYSNSEQAIALTSDAMFGILPYRRPLDNEILEKKVAQTVMSTKLSDYISLNLLPIVPDWCTSAAEYVSRHKIGIVYTSKYEFSHIQYAALNCSNYYEQMSIIRSDFDTDNIAKCQLSFFESL